MKKIWIHKANSFKEAKKFDIEYYFSMTNRERIETMQFLRDIYSKMAKGKQNEGGKGLRRIIKVLQ